MKGHYVVKMKVEDLTIDPTMGVMLPTKTMSLANAQATKGRNVLIVAKNRLRGHVLAENVPVQNCHKIGVTSLEGGDFMNVTLVGDHRLHTIILEDFEALPGYDQNKFEDKVASLLVDPDDVRDPVIYMLDRSPAMLEIKP